MNSSMPVTMAQQTFTIVSGVAGGLAGFYLARELTGVDEVPIPAVVTAAMISGIATFGAVFIITREVRNGAGGGWDNG
jgi:hypothetical protein